MYFSHTLYVSVLLACLAICQGLPKFSKDKSKSNHVDDGGGAEVVQMPVIQFPSIDEMTSSERETNRKMARTIANIIERNIHMVANDVLQILTLARTQSGSKDGLDDDPVEPMGNDLDAKGDKDFDNMK